MCKGCPVRRNDSRFLRRMEEPRICYDDEDCIDNETPHDAGTSLMKSEQPWNCLKARTALQTKLRMMAHRLQGRKRRGIPISMKSALRTKLRPFPSMLLHQMAKKTSVVILSALCNKE